MSVSIGNNPNLEYSKPLIDPTLGLFWEQRWCGTRDAIDNLILQLNIQEDERVTYDESSRPLWRVTIVSPDYRNGQSNATNSWEVVHNSSEISLKEHPKSRALGHDELKIIDQLLKDKVLITEIEFGSTDSAILYNNLLKGASKTQDFERVFRYSITTSARFASMLTESYIGRLFSTTSLLTPAISGLIVPAATAGKLVAVQAWASTNRPNINETVSCPGIGGGTTTVLYQWSWMKQPADTEQLPSGKLRHTQEFWGYRWSTWEYGTVL